MAWYSVGTVAVTNGSATVTGSNTQWDAEIVLAGDAFLGPDGALYEISAVNSATQITLAHAYGSGTASGQAYKIVPTRHTGRQQYSAVKDLIQTVHDKVDPLDAWQAAREGEISTLLADRSADIDGWLANADSNFDSRIPFGENLFKDPLFKEYDDTGGPKVPLHISAAGVTIEAVSTYTKAFEHKSQANNAGTTADPEAATAALPYWENAYSSGPRFPRGGLSGGWGSGGGVERNILKMTSVAGAANDHRYVQFSPRVDFHASYLRFRAYLKLSAGTVLGVGSHAGFSGGIGTDVSETELINEGLRSRYRFEKTLLDTGPQGWSFIDVGISAEISMNFHLRLTIGFQSDEAVEAYLAMPQVYIPKSSPFKFVE